MGLYFGGEEGYIYLRAYIWDVNWVTYFGGIYLGGLYTRAYCNGILWCIRKRSGPKIDPCRVPQFISPASENTFSSVI